MNKEDYFENQAWSSAPPRGSFWIVIFLLLSLFVCVTLTLLVPGGLGFVAGYNELQMQNHESAIQHFQRGLGYLAENYPELAYTEFEIAVRYDPEYEPARAKLIEMQAIMKGVGTPGAQDGDRIAAALLEEARDLLGKRQWSDAITRLEQLRTVNPHYKPAETNDLLYQAYVSGGQDAKAGGQIELARERFDAALNIRNTDPAVQRQRDLAVLYLDGQQAVGYNWQLAIQKFSALYQQDPNYNDVKKRLVDAYVQYGDVAARQNAWCLAQREYEGALAIQNDGSVATKRTQAASMCRQVVMVTPSPIAAPGSENYVARIATTFNKPCNTGTGDVTGVVRDALGQPLANIGVAYYADGINRVTARTNAAGQYQFVWGVDAGLFHVIVLSPDGKTPAGVAADVQYPGANHPGCHIIVDWTKVQ